jgi:glutathione S-transferase
MSISGGPCTPAAARVLASLGVFLAREYYFGEEVGVGDLAYACIKALLRHGTTIGPDADGVEARDDLWPPMRAAFEMMVAPKGHSGVKAD